MAEYSVYLSDSHKKFVENEMNQKGYLSISDYLNALILEDRKRKDVQRLEAILEEGLSSEFQPMTKQDWEEIRQEVKRRHEERTA